MKRRRIALTLEQHGVSMVEFALTLPFLVFLIMGAFDIGWAVYINNSLAIAAREGARRAIIVAPENASAADIQANNQNVCDWTRKGLQSLPLNCFYQNNAPAADAQGIFVQPALRQVPNTPGTPVRVTVQYRYMPITPIFTPFAPNGIMLSSTATRVAE